MASHHTRQQLVRLAWGHQGDPANFDPKPLFAEIKACAGEEGRHLSRALPKLWKHLDYRAYDGMRFARATGLSAESFEALMGVLSKGRGKTLLDYRFPASPAAMLFVALAVGRFDLRYHGGTLAAKPEGFWYPSHISLAFARVWPNHLGLELFEGLVDSLMNVPPRGLLDIVSMTVGRVEPFCDGLRDEPNAPYGRQDEATGRIRDDKAERILYLVRSAFGSEIDLAVPLVYQDPSAKDLRKALTVLAKATGWDGASGGRPRMGSLTPKPLITLRNLAAILVIAAYLRRDHGVFPSHQWSRAKLIMAMASIWPIALDVGIFDQLLENVYGRSDFEHENIVGLIG
jgi:hypothetical protein